MRVRHVPSAILALALLSLISCAGPGAPTQEPAPPGPSALAQPTIVTSIPSSPTPVPATSTPVAASARPLPPSPTPLPPTPTPVAPTNTPPPSDTPAPSSTPLPTATAMPALPQEPDPVVGAELWPQLSCSGCHGANAEGDSGPRLAGTGLSIADVLARVRLGKGSMPAFAESEVSDLAVRHIHAWLRSLTKPAPSPIARPSFPTQALSEMWVYVNEMRIRADFAKDLPVRVAQDDAGRLKVVHDYSRDGLAQAAQVTDRANRALNEVPNESVKAILHEIIAETNAVSDRFNQALAQNSYAAAWVHVAEAVRICRIDTLPWATQAIRDAGLVGTVRMRVTNQGGAPIAGALATALTAHSPLSGRTDSGGWVTFTNVAAVPALQVKAYVAGRVYHEINVNLAPGQTVQGAIALPPLPGPQIAPAVADASISPASGAGNATVTFALTATDPQGALDLAEDQIFALNPDLGVAYVLRSAGNNRYQLPIALPNLSAGAHTWFFFAVDHACNTSNIIAVRYTAQ